MKTWTRDSSECKVSLTSRQLRIRNVRNTRFCVAVCSKIALEESNGLIFSRNPNEDEHQTIMKESKMTLMKDSYKEINDFEWPDPSTPSPHWTAEWTNEKSQNDFTCINFIAIPSLFCYLREIETWKKTFC